MLAAFASSLSADDPLSGLVVADRPDPSGVPEGWTVVEVRAASLNHHDLWSLRGVGLGEQALPMILGCDAAGIDKDGNEVIVHAVVTRTPTGAATRRSTRGARSSPSATRGRSPSGSMVPRRNLVPKPPELSFAEAACLPTAWLTAYRMLFTRAVCSPGSTLLVQGAGGGVATALIVLGRAAGLRVWATSRSEDKRARALELGADAVFATGRAAARARRRGRRDRRRGDVGALAEVR